MPGHPDEQVHETATGAALKTVEAHKEPQDLVFYAGWVRSCSSLPRSELH